MQHKELVNKIHDLYNNKYNGISGDEVMIYLLEKNLEILDRLDKGTNKLNRFTGVLVILTLVLTALAGAQIYLFVKG